MELKYLEVIVQGTDVLLLGNIIAKENTVRELLHDIPIKK